ncbi:MAG: prolyl oligopeptidase family serine peptidase, partial [Planctomycetota bacterium]|nr:prolyl oligopeptidase family serine peptidase [Planctomycetota bacterium]
VLRSSLPVLLCVFLSAQTIADEQKKEPPKKPPKQAKEDLRVAPEGIGGVKPDGMLHRYLLQKAYKAFDAADKEYEKIKTPQQIAVYQRRMHAFFVEQLGGFPKRTPLNAKVTGKLNRDGYRIEKIIYESQPRLYVTALLYLPDEKTCSIKPPYPGVLFPCGHSTNGKACEAYQRGCVLLAKNGFVVLCYDPIEQGERYQLLHKNGKPRVGGTRGHNATNISSMPLGRNTATYRIWDGMRGIDYLQTRKEVDPQRIGCTGNSGGGTLTSYIMALDERVDCAAPSCYLTDSRRLLDTIGPQDAEQNIFAQVAYGMGLDEYVIMRAPRPTLMCTATKDFFDIDGAWKTFRSAKRIYGRLDFAERMDLVETDAKHGFSTQLRVGAVRWMRRWLLKIDDAITEADFTILSDKEAQVAPKGQVVLIDGARTTYDFDADLETKLAEKRKALWQGDKTKALDAVRKITGIRRPADLPKLKCKKTGTIKRDGYHIDKLALAVEAGLWLPALAFVPEKAGAKDGKKAPQAYLFLNAAGKQADAGLGGPMEKLVKQGHLVLALDPRGIAGKSKSHTYDKAMGRLWTECSIAYLLGTSLVAMQAEDITAAAAFLRDYQSPQKPRQVNLVSTGNIGVAALHAAALAPELFESFRLRRCLDSWSDVVRTPLAKQQYPTLVFAALKTYDLPDLRRALPDGKLTVVEPLDANGKTIR